MTNSSRSSIEDFATNGPPPPGALDAVERHFGYTLPAEYKSFMSHHDGGEGFIGDQYLILWRTEELIALNRDYESDKYAPGLLLFGSNGGGEAFAFNISDPEMAIRMVPFIGMSLENAVTVANGFDNFLVRLAESNETLP